MPVSIEAGIPAENQQLACTDDNFQRFITDVWLFS